MRQLTGKNGRRGTIRIIETLDLSDGVVLPTAHREWPTSGVDGPRPAQQSDETKPLSNWERYIVSMVFRGWCRLAQNLRNKPNVNLNKLCGLIWFLMSHHAARKTKQTKPTLPEWQSGKLRGLLSNGANEAIAVLMAAWVRKRRNEPNVNLERFRGMRRTGGVTGVDQIVAESIRRSRVFSPRPAGWSGVPA
jgi:hypothetical protein